ncbi:unnamed protein product, partial [Heterotrigona itama]
TVSRILKSNAFGPIAIGSNKVATIIGPSTCPFSSSGSWLQNELHGHPLDLAVEITECISSYLRNTHTHCVRSCTLPSERKRNIRHNAIFIDNIARARNNPLTF